MRDNIVIRSFVSDDVERGIVETLEILSPVRATPEQIRRQLARRPEDSFVLVADSLYDGIVGTLSGFVDFKFIHACGRALHIEEVAVRPSWQGKGIGKRLMQEAYRVARWYRCYKVVLYCGEDKVGFYEKVGMRRAGVAMRLDLPD